MDKTKQARVLDRKPALTKPISIRLTQEEIVELKRLAGSLSVSEYMRRQLFGDVANVKSENASEMRLTPQARQKLLAQILMRLGQLDTVKNVNLLIESIETGLIYVSPEVLSEFSALHREIQNLRQDLLKALGLRP